ncbi:MAG TPA: hypothetical protein VNX68_16090 [Nitrosopumilaceae archaeon]|jgi:hypothetical protein|nr:hypothetical protein [Nitrosopumilaceae archaeon]
MQETLTGKHCKLLKPIRDHDGRSRFNESPIIVREMDNVDRHMYLIKFDDGATTYVYPEEVTIK